MASIVLIGIALALLFFKLYRYATYRPPGFPPGPPRIPIFGSYLFLLLLDYSDLHKAALKLSRFYKSKVIGLYLGGFLAVVANDYESVRELFLRPEFDGKSDTFVGRIRHPREELRGIFFLDGPVWKKQRWFMLRYLRDFGFGRRHEGFELHIRDELQNFIEMLGSAKPKYDHEREFLKDGYALIPTVMFGMMANLILQVLIGERFPRADQGSLLEAGKCVILWQRTGDDYGRLLAMVPWIRYFFPKSSGFADFRRANEGLFRFTRSLIDRQMENYDPSHQRHFLDLYIKELREKDSSEETGFNYDQFIINVLDFYFPANTANAAQLGLFLQMGIRKPEMVRRIQAEIDEVVGQGRLPTLDDRAKMPYTEACLRENMRFDTPLPSGLPHKALVETTFQGYTVPKDTIMISGHFAIHHDRDLWGDPENFRPERFLDSEGRLDLKRDISLPFGAGHRLCAGETFARNIMFLFIASIYQNFTPQLPPSDRIEKIVAKNRTGIIRTTPDFWMKFERR